MEHTKGPWKARNQISVNGDDGGWIIETDEGRGGRIGWSSRAFADTNKEEERGGTEAKANAFLMAASPDLYEAAKAILTDKDHENNIYLINQLRKAVKKAEKPNV